MKIITKILGIAFVTFSIYLLTEFLLYANNFINKYNILKRDYLDADISNHKPVKCNKKFKTDIWLISYGEGETYLANQNGLVASSLNKCIDFFKSYRKEHIEANYFEAHKEILLQPRGAGYWLWKPYFILKTLQEMPENDILLYLDTGVLVVKPVDTIINDALAEKDIAFFMQPEAYPETRKNKAMTRRLLFKIMDMDNEEAHQSDQAEANKLLIRNTKFAREFIAKWLYWSEIPEAITDLPLIDEYPEFIEHRHDQSILSLLALQNKDKINFLKSELGEKYFYEHRRRSMGKVSLISPYARLSIID